MEMEFGPKVIFELPFLGGIPVTETVVNTWIVMAILTVIAVIATRNFQKIPKGRQNFVELIVEFITNLTVQTMGKDKIRFASYMGTLFILMLFSNLLGLIALRPPTADLNTTLALALLTFFMTQFYGIRSKGIGTYLKGYLQPMPFMLPLNIIGELANPISLSFRLFGNIVGGMIITALMYNGLLAVSGALGLSAFPILQGVIPVVFHLYFDVFAGLLQSFIFVMLSMVFISGAMD